MAPRNKKPVVTSLGLVEGMHLVVILPLIQIDALMFRVCPGQYLAENSIFLFVSNILANFNVAPLDKTQGGIQSTDEAVFTPYLVQ